MTRILKVDPNHPEDDVIEEAARLVEAGRIIVYPTDTIYGVGTNALNPTAVRRIFEAKNRPLGNPFPIVVDGIEMVERLTVVTWEARRLMKAFWPGALTLVLTKKDPVPDIVTAGRLEVAVRAPNHQVPLKMIMRLGLPLIATSANIHGSTNCRTAQEATKQIGDRVDLILDGGSTAETASTILDLTQAVPKILREGPVTRMMLRQVLGYDVG